MADTNIDVLLRLQAQQFAKEIRKSEQRVARFARQNQRQLKQAGRAWKTFKTQVAGLLSAAVIKAGFSKMQGAVGDLINELDKLGKTADGLGMTIEQFSALSGIAVEAGVQQDKFAKGLAKLNKVVIDADAGLTTYTRAFERLGISIHAPNGQLKSSKDILFELKAAIDSTGASQASIASIMDIFGARIGPQMIRALMDMENSMEGVTDRASKLGVVLEQKFTDAAQGARNEMDVLGQRLRAAGAEIFLPHIRWWEQVAEKIGEATIALRNYFGEGEKFADTSLATKMAELQALEQDRDLRAYEGAEERGVTHIPSSIKEKRVRMAQLREQIRAESLRQAHAPKFLEGDKARNAAEAKRNTEAEAAREAAAEKERQALEDHEKRKEEIRQAWRDAEIAKATEFSTMQAQSLELRNQMVTEQDQREIAAIQRAHELKIDTWGKELSAIEELIEAKEREIRTKQKEKTASEQFAQSLYSNLQGAFANVISGTHSVEDAFKMMIKNMMIQMASQALARGAMMAMGFPGFAGGGMAQGGKPIMVGESGREMFVPSTAGRVLSHPQTERAMAGGGGGAVHNTFNIQSSDGPGVRAAIAEAMPVIVEASKASLADDMSRPSVMRQTIRGYA